jgi:hypothetical protein
MRLVVLMFEKASDVASEAIQTPQTGARWERRGPRSDRRGNQPGFLRTAWSPRSF